MYSNAWWQSLFYFLACQKIYISIYLLDYFLLLSGIQTNFHWVVLLLSLVVGSIIDLKWLRLKGESPQRKEKHKRIKMRKRKRPWVNLPNIILSAISEDGRALVNKNVKLILPSQFFYVYRNTIFSLGLPNTIGWKWEKKMKTSCSIYYKNVLHKEPFLLQISPFFLRNQYESGQKLPLHSLPCKFITPRSCSLYNVMNVIYRNFLLLQLENHKMVACMNFQSTAKKSRRREVGFLSKVRERGRPTEYTHSIHL